MEHEYKLSPDADTYGEMAAKLAGMTTDGVLEELIAWRSLLNVNADRAATAATAYAMTERELSRRETPETAAALNGAAQRLLEAEREMVALAYADFARDSVDVEAEESSLPSDSAPANPAKTIRRLGDAEVLGEMARCAANLNAHADPAMCAADLIRLLQAEARRRGLPGAVELNFSARQIMARPWLDGHN